MKGGIIIFIINNGNIFTNEQINEFVQLLNKDYHPKTIVMHETRTDFLKKASKYSTLALDSIEILSGGLEGIYYQDSDEVHIFIFSQDDDGDDIQSHQLYSLHALLHEMRHRYHYIHKINMKETKEEIDADKFATKFINKNSEAISKIMGWKDEWTVAEED